MIGAVFAAALCASSVRTGADFLDLLWIRPDATEQVLRTKLAGSPPSAAAMVVLAPGGSAAAIRDHSAFRILPGNARLDGARAAAFSPDGRRIAAALASGQIVAAEVNGGAREVLGRMSAVERLAWGAGVVAAGVRGAVLLPKRVLTRAPVREVAVGGDRIALLTPSTVLLFDGSGRLLRRMRASASALALSPGGTLAYGAGREVWVVEAGSPPRRLAREAAPIRQIVFAGERASWVAEGAHRADGSRLDCATFLDATRGLLATCPARALAWDGPERTVHAVSDCNVQLAWTVPLGDGLLVAQVLRDRRFTVPCGERGF